MLSESFLIIATHAGRLEISTQSMNYSLERFASPEPPSTIALVKRESLPALTRLVEIMHKRNSSVGAR